VLCHVQGTYTNIKKKKKTVSLPHAERCCDRGSNQIIVRLQWGMNEWALNGKVDENIMFAISVTLGPICNRLLRRPKPIFSHIFSV
jgi:hypothetical protein